MFLPRVNDRLQLGSEAYSFTEHPAAKGMPYGQTGRRATVFQLKDQEGQKRALKVFQANYRSAENLEKTSDLLKYAPMPGLATCERFVITKSQFPSLIQQNRDLDFSLLMPWVEGNTWQDIVLNKISLEPDRCYELASSLNMVLGSMEVLGMAHCDLSGPNIILRPKELQDDDEDLVSLIDLEEMYTPKLKRPKTVPAGSAGYAHTCVKSGVWSADADRFSGSILLSNMLTWSDSSVVQAAFGEQFFSPDEMHLDCPRYQTLVGSLEKRWGKNASELLSTAWHSKDLGDCPTFRDWADVLSVEIPEFPALELELESKLKVSKPNLPTIPSFVPPSHQTRPVVINSNSPVRGFRSLFDPQSPVQANKNLPAPEWLEYPNPVPVTTLLVEPTMTQTPQPVTSAFRSRFKEIERLSNWHEVDHPARQSSEKISVENPEKTTHPEITVLFVFFGLFAIILVFAWLASL